MATRKPDWADRMVEQQQDYGRVIAKSDAAALLRAHHRKVKRMVLEVGNYWSTSVASAIRYILDKLKELEQ